MADGHQRLRKRPSPPDDETLEEEEDGVVTFRRNEGNQVEINLEATRDLLESLTTDDTSASVDHIESFQYRDDDEESRVHREENNNANNMDRDYSQYAQRMSDERLDLSVDSHQTPEQLNNLPGNAENATGGLDSPVGSDRERVAYYQASTFEGMAPDFFEKSPRTQKKILKEADGVMEEFCRKAQRDKVDMAKKYANMLVDKDQENRDLRRQVKVLKASQANLVEAAKTANRVRDNTAAPQAVRPKDNSRQQSRGGSRDRVVRTNQVPPRRNRRDTSVDGSSSDNRNDARPSRSRNRRSSPRDGVRRQRDTDRIGQVPNPRGRNSNNARSPYLSGQSQGQFPVFPDSQNYVDPQIPVGPVSNNNGGQNYASQGLSSNYPGNMGIPQQAAPPYPYAYGTQNPQTVNMAGHSGVYNQGMPSTWDPADNRYQLPRPVNANNVQLPYRPTHVAQQGGFAQASASAPPVIQNQGVQNDHLAAALAQLAKAQTLNSESQLQYAAAKAHPKYIKFRGGVDGVDIETYILRNEQNMNMYAPDTEKILRLAANLGDDRGVSELLSSGWKGTYESFKAFLLLTFSGARKQIGIATWASVQRYQNETIQQWQVRMVELISLTWQGWLGFTNSERELIMRQMELIVPLAALAMYKDASGEYDADLLKTKEFPEILRQLRVHQDNLYVLWKPFNDKLPRQAANAENRVNTLNESNRDSSGNAANANRSNRGNQSNNKTNKWCSIHRVTSHATQECRSRGQGVQRPQSGAQQNNRPEKYCRHHRTTTHNTEDCRDPDVANRNQARGNNSNNYNNNQNYQRQNNNGNYQNNRNGNFRGNNRGRGNYQQNRNNNNNNNSNGFNNSGNNNNSNGNSNRNGNYQGQGRGGYNNNYGRQNNNSRNNNNRVNNVSQNNDQNQDNTQQPPDDQNFGGAAQNQQGLGVVQLKK